MTDRADALVDGYMKQLERELADFPSGRRRQLLEEISKHISEARAGGLAQTETEVRTELDRLGDPADIADEARDRFGVTRPRSGTLEVAALIVLSLGAVFLPVVGPLAGLVLVWSSRAWTPPEKWLATLVITASVLLPPVFFGFNILAILAVMVAAGLAVAAYLGHKLNRGRV
jgi:hypothetical protein